MAARPITLRHDFRPGHGSGQESDLPAATLIGSLSEGPLAGVSLDLEPQQRLLESGEFLPEVSGFLRIGVRGQFGFDIKKLALEIGVPGVDLVQGRLILDPPLFGREVGGSSAAGDWLSFSMTLCMSSMTRLSLPT